MNLSGGSLPECKTLFDEYRCCRRKIKSYTFIRDTLAITDLFSGRRCPRRVKARTRLSLKSRLLGAAG